MERGAVSKIVGTKAKFGFGVGAGIKKRPDLEFTTR